MKLGVEIGSFLFFKYVYNYIFNLFIYYQLN